MTRGPEGRERVTARLAGREVQYTLVRSRRRSIGLQVDDRGLTVRMPLRASRRWLQGVLEQHALWILGKLDQWAARPRPVDWDEGATFPLLGRRFAYAPRTDGDFEMIELRGGQLGLPLSTGVSPAEVQRRVGGWYRAQALAWYRERVGEFSGRLGVPVPEVALSNARTQWGSCSLSTGIRLSWRLIMLPPRLVDYVVAHEVAHLLEMNHSPRFWSVVARLYPDYASARRELSALG